MFPALRVWRSARSWTSISAIGSIRRGAASWRDNIINERLANRWQKSFLDAASKSVTALDRWHLPRFRTEIAALPTQLSLHACEWEEDIDRKVAAEHAFEAWRARFRSNRRVASYVGCFPGSAALPLDR